MASSDLMRREKEFMSSLSIFDLPQGDVMNSRGRTIERMIDDLEVVSKKVSNRRSRRWLNDRLLLELVPQLSVEEIRGLFAPPPWGDSAPVSTFSMRNVNWDAFRSVDMDVETNMLKRMDNSSDRKTHLVNRDKLMTLNAWHRVDCRTREVLRRNFLSDILEGYECQLRAYLERGEETDVLVLHIPDPFHRLMLHGVCEFYNLNSATDSAIVDGKLLKITTIKRKVGNCVDLPNVTLVQFLTMAKHGVF